MSRYRTEKSGDKKMPIWIDAKTHQKIKVHCARIGKSIKDFVLETIYRELNKSKEKLR